MKILVLTPTYLPIKGGAESLIFEVYRRIGEKHTVQVLTPHLPKRLLRAFGGEQLGTSATLPVTRFPDPLNPLRFRGHRLTLGLFPPFSLSAIWAVKTAIEQFEPDIINAYYAIPTGLAAAWAQCMQNVPVVLSFIGRDIPGPHKPLGWKFYDRLVARCVREVTYLSDYCRAALYGSPDGGKGRTIYGGVDLDRFHPQVDGTTVRTKLGISADTTVLLAVQRLSPEKRVDILVKSMPRILKHEPNTRLILVGKGTDAARLERLSRYLNVDNEVFFIGYVPDEELPLYFAAADIFAFHSIYETFGIVLAEAMASAKPIVSVESTAIPEVVDHGINGLLVEPLNLSDFAESTLHLVRDKELRERLGQNGRDKAEQFFNWDTIAREYEDVLHSALG